MCKQKNNLLATILEYSIFSIFQFPIMHSAYPQILHKLLLQNALGNMQTSQEYFTTIVYAKFGGKQSTLWTIGK